MAKFGSVAARYPSFINILSKISFNKSTPDPSHPRDTANSGICDSFECSGGKVQICNPTAYAAVGDGDGDTPPFDCI